MDNNKPIRVAHILNEIRPSGAEVMLRLAASGWRAQGCELIAIATADRVGEFAGDLQNSGFAVEHCPSGVRSGAGLSRLLKTIRRLRPDVVHVHTESNSALLIGAIRLLGIAVVRTVHNSFPYTGTLRWRKIFERFIERIGAAFLVSISQSVYENELYRLKNPTTLCWNWFDDSRFRPPTPLERDDARAQLGLSSQDVAIVSVGNGNDVKNYPAIIEALAILRNTKSIRSASDRTSSFSPQPSLPPSTLDSGVSTPLYLMVGNEHPQRLERSTAERLGLAEKVRFCGPQQDVRRYLWGADIFIMPSLYEGFGLSAVEALATGIPTILSDCPGLCDFRGFPLRIQWTGTSPNSISESVAELLRAPGHLARDPDSAAKVRKEFGVARRSAEYLRLWQKASGRACASERSQSAHLGLPQ